MSTDADADENVDQSEISYPRIINPPHHLRLVADDSVDPSIIILLCLFVLLLFPLFVCFVAFFRCLFVLLLFPLFVLLLFFRCLFVARVAFTDYIR